MGVVVPFGQIAIDLHQLQPHDLEPPLLVPREDATRQLALDAIGLDEDEGAFDHSGSPCGGWSSGRAASA
jgi:hypothetical protein